MTAELEVGQRWIYTSPSGRREAFTVRDVEAEPRAQIMPGKCVRLVADHAGWHDVVTWPVYITDEPYWERER